MGMPLDNVISRLLTEGATRGVYRQARASVIHRGAVVFDGGTAASGARFDLASVTKVMSTTALLCHFARHEKLEMETPIRRFLPEVTCDNVSLLDLAYHRSGLPAFHHFFEAVFHKDPSLRSDLTLPKNRAPARSQVIDHAVTIQPAQPPRVSSVYSDVGFLWLGIALERIGKAPLDVIFERHVAKPLGLNSTGFRRPSLELTDTDIVSTQHLRPREPAPGQHNVWTTTTMRSCSTASPATLGSLARPMTSHGLDRPFWKVTSSVQSAGRETRSL
jgi:serine-type D-Ala-D-Ala carboxypeptidase